MRPSLPAFAHSRRRLTIFVKRQHEQDLAKGYGSVQLPEALARKYTSAEKDVRWQFLFPASRLAQDPRTGIMRRHHIHQSVIQKCITRAARQSGILKRVTSPDFSPGGEMIAQGFGYTRKLVKERNTVCISD